MNVLKLLFGEPAVPVLCRDCKFFTPKTNFTVGTREYYSFARCHAPTTKVVTRSLVSGGILNDEPYCDSARLRIGSCGPKGKLYVPR